MPALLVAAAALLFLWWLTPPAGLDDWAAGPPPERWSTLQRHRSERQEAARQDGDRRPPIRYAYRPLAQISLELQLAVLVGEDINFFGHSGIDFTAIQEAFAEWRDGERLRGASTISQQLAKNLFLSNERSWLRKLREARLARGLENELGKRRILELYLNVIEFGDGVLGVEAAARHYYGTDVGSLTQSEAAGLAATIPAPHTSNPATATSAWQNRREIIEERMAEADWLRRLLESNQGGRDGRVAGSPATAPARAGRRYAR
jgi:monofunctional biosynthetic peptidoglycan transglycosylase